MSWRFWTTLLHAFLVPRPRQRLMVLTGRKGQACNEVLTDRGFNRPSFGAEAGTPPCFQLHFVSFLAVACFANLSLVAEDTAPRCSRALDKTTPQGKPLACNVGVNPCEGPASTQPSKADRAKRARKTAVGAKARLGGPSVFWMTSNKWLYKTSAASPVGVPNIAGRR